MHSTQHQHDNKQHIFHHTHWLRRNSMFPNARQLQAQDSAGAAIQQHTPSANSSKKLKKNGSHRHPQAEMSTGSSSEFTEKRKHGDHVYSWR